MGKGKVVANQWGQSFPEAAWLCFKLQLFHDIFLCDRARSALLRMYNYCLPLGGVHKLRLQEQGGRWSKKLTFCKPLYHRKCKRRGVGGQKKTNLVKGVCKRPLMAAWTAQNSPELKICFIDSFIQWSVVLYLGLQVARVDISKKPVH